MGAEENEDKTINLLEVQPDIPEEEPIEQVFSQEPEDIKSVEPSTESEDQERFEETAKFEEEIDAPKVEPKPVQKQARKSKVTRKRATKGVNENKSVSKLHDEIRKHSDARKKAEREILDIRKELKDLLLVHHATIKDLQKQVAQMHRKIASIDSSKKSAKVKTTAKKTTLKKKTSSNSKSKKKSGLKKSRKR
jgi:predicted phage tail protein